MTEFTDYDLKHLSAQPPLGTNEGIVSEVVQEILQAEGHFQKDEDQTEGRLEVQQLKMSETVQSVVEDLQSENSLLLSRVQACKELEQKLRDMSDEDLELDGCYLSTQEADVLKSEIRKQGEQIWIELKKKLFSVVSKPYQIVAKEEANEEYKLLKGQYEELEAEMIKLQTQLQEQHIQVTEKSQKSVQGTDKGTMTEEQIQHTDQTNLPVVDVSFLKEMAISPEEQNKEDTASGSKQLQSETEQETDTTAAVAKVL